MQKLFGLSRDTNQGVMSVPEWDYVRQELLRSLNTVTSFYHRFPSRIDGSHFLIKVLYGIGVNRDQPLDRYYGYVTAKAMNHAMALGMTSSISKGKLFDGIFYGGDTKEILIGHDEDFDFEKAAASWQELEPIRVLHHPKSDLNMNVPDGTTTSSEDGLAVIAINIPMLLIQYREFMKREQMIAEATGESPRGVQHFIFSYPLTNMLRSHLDVAIFNRLYNTLFDIPFGQSSKKHSFYITDSSNRLNIVQRKQVELLRKSTKRFDTIMRSIPMVSVPTMSELAELPDMVVTRQVVWGLAASRLQMLSFLFNATGDDPRIQNASEVNHVLRTFQIYRTDMALRSSLPYSLYFDARSDLDKIATERQQA